MTVVKAKDCSITKTGFRVYSGKEKFTVDGRECLPWDQLDEQLKFNLSVDDHNYCRNPDGDLGGAWCFTDEEGNTEDYHHADKGKGHSWGYCRVSNCGKSELKSGTRKALCILKLLACKFELLGHVSIEIIYYKNGSKVTEMVHPAKTSHYLRANGRCAKFNINKFSNVREILLQSPVPVNIYLHGRNQFYSRELRSFIGFNGKQAFEVKVEKTKNIEVTQGSCSQGLEFEEFFVNITLMVSGNLDEKILERLNNYLLNQLNCTVPFLPPDIRRNSTICKDPKKGKIATDIYYGSPIEALNLWTDFQGLKPPCVFHRYQEKERYSYEGEKNKIWRLYQENFRSMDSRTQELWIEFESEMKVEEQIWTYTFMSYIAENGGFVGLFLGYSVLSIGEGFWKALKWFCEPKASIYQ